MDPPHGCHGRRARPSATPTTAVTISAKPAIGSRRSSIGRAPAWFGPPASRTDVVPDARDRVDDADRNAGRLEHRPLLDVELDPDVDVVAAASGIRAGSSPIVRIASAIVTPSKSRIRSGSSGPIVP